VLLRRLFLPVVLVFVLVLSAGCELIPEFAPGEVQESPPTAEEQDSEPINPNWEASTPAGESPFLPSIADVVASVKPSVVTITTEVVTVDLFNRPYTQEGGGTGWIIDESGIVVTNNHVVEGAESITVTLDDGRLVEVDVSTVATDRQTDLAILKIDAEGLSAAPVGDSARLRVGDWVVALGNSLGLGIRATQGIVSRKEVVVEEELGQPLKLIETDAAINPGNSGGPLVSMAGKVIGINSIKLVDVQVEGVGYAIGSNEAMPIISQLIKTGYVIRPWLGVGTQTVTPTVVFWQRLSVDTGVLITHVAAGSPADRAGLEAGDVVTSFNGAEVTTAQKMVSAIHAAEAGQTVEIVYWRGDVRHTTQATLVESPPPG